MAYIESLPEKVPLYIGKTTVPKNWGLGQGEDIITTDETIQYLLELLKERFKETGKEYVLTTSITTVSNLSPQDSQSIEGASTFIADNYHKIMSENKEVSGIYTVLNVNSGRKGDAMHQNWLFFSVEEMKLLRFEPSSDFLHYRTRELCEKIIEKLKKKDKKYENAKYEIAEEGVGINSFMGCRAMSTLLAALHIKNINLEHVNIFKTKQGEKKLVKPFAYLMQKEMRSCIKDSKKPKPPTRRDPFPYIIVGREKK